MAEKILSIFIDESGDFGTYDYHAPNYYVAIVMHEQKNNIEANIKNLNEHISILDMRFMQYIQDQLFVANRFTGMI